VSIAQQPRDALLYGPRQTPCAGRHRLEPENQHSLSTSPLNERPEFAATQAAAATHQPAPHAPVEFCLNCGNQLAGAHCHSCGQRRTNPIVSLGESASELLGEFIKFDSKLFSSVRLLLARPGGLTVEYVAGRRRRHVQPVKLYLIINFFCFLLTGWLDPITFTQAELAGLLRPLKAPPAEPFLAQLNSILAPMLLLVVPALAAALKLLYIRSRRFYAAHFIFAVHYLSFFMLFMIPGMFYEPLYYLFTLPAAAVHMALALRRVYWQSWAKTMVKTAILYPCFIVLLTFWMWFCMLYAFFAA